MMLQLLLSSERDLINWDKGKLKPKCQCGSGAMDKSKLGMD